MRRCKVAVVGAGASGLMAALHAAAGLKKPGAVLLLEGNPKPGNKLLATGKGRCNLTNLDISPGHYHGDPVPQGLWRRFSGETILAQFHQLGLLTRQGTEGRMYPNSLQAASVVHALCGACAQAGVETLCGYLVEGLAPVRGGYLLTGPGGQEVFAQRVVLSCGGKASPRLSAGEGYRLAQGLGHTPTGLAPSLVGLRVGKKLPRALKGLRCRARAALTQNGRELYGESGEVIFGTETVSGICVMNLTARLRGLSQKGLALSLDLLEDMGAEELLAYLEKRKSLWPQRPAGELLAGALPLGLGWELVKAAGMDPDRALSAVTEKELAQAAGKVKGFRLEILGPDGWENAQATAGGVPLCQVDLATLESKLAPGVYLTGELLNVDGDCGGYNLHWAWVTGILAGQAAGGRAARNFGGARP